LRSRTRPALWAIALLAVASLTAAACGSDGGGSSTPGSDAPNATSAPDGDVDFSALSGTLPGSGATFPMAFYEEAISEFQSIGSGLTVTYGGGGSGKGKQDLADEIVVWAGSDSLVKEADLAGFKGGEIFYFPTVAAPITVSYNVDGLDDLQLSADTIAGIFQREITTWDDPIIAADNPDADLPSEAIVVARRADGSGTTTNFTKYLDKAASNWTLGSGDTVAWPADTQAGQGNGGVAQIVQSTPGAIGYVDLSDAVASDLQIAAVKNKDGQYVEPTLEAASAALDGAEVNADLTYDPLDAAGAEAYPITAPTWVLTYQTVSAENLENLVGWLTFLLTDAQEIAPDVDYAPLPASLQEKALAQLAEITAG
jgi:phosphate transport system substrate-binding protein